MKTKFHKDGTITFWSVFNQQWVKNAQDISDRELSAMSEKEREKVQKHLGI